MKKKGYDEIHDCPVCEGPAVAARNGDWRCANCGARGATVNGELCVLRGGLK